MTRRSFGVIATTLALAVVPVPTAPAAPTDVGCSAGAITLRTLHIEAVPQKRTVHPGERFKVDVTVTRPAHEDPLDQGIEFDPPASQPAEGVTANLSVWPGERTYFWAIGLTDENGEDTVTLRVPRNSELGWAFAGASARHWIRNDCPDILEVGDTQYARFVKIVP